MQAAALGQAMATIREHPMLSLISFATSSVLQDDALLASERTFSIFWSYKEKTQQCLCRVKAVCRA